MRRLSFVWFGLWAVAGLTAGPASRLPRVELFGREYVSLSKWAERYHFQPHWRDAKKEFQLTSRWSDLRFDLNSHEARLNGVEVWLSAPVAGWHGDAYLSTVDLKTVLDPIMFPVPIPGPIRTIVLDPGHGGKDPGNQESGHQEKAYTLLLAKELKSQLVAAGYHVWLTRTSDRYVDLDSRPAFAHQKRADLFLSLHFNANGGDGVAHGIEVYCLTPAGESSTNVPKGAGEKGRVAGNAWDSQNIYLAYQLQRFLVGDLKREDRGVRRARFAVLRSARMPAALVEGGFMSDPTESREIYDPHYRQRMARAIVRAIQTFRRRVER